MKLKNFKIGKGLFLKKQKPQENCEEQLKEQMITLKRFAKLNMLEGWLCSEYYHFAINNEHSKSIYKSQKHILKSIADQQIEFNYSIINNGSLPESRIDDFSKNSYFSDMASGFLSMNYGTMHFCDYPVKDSIPLGKYIFPAFSLENKYDYMPIIEKLIANKYNKNVNSKLEKLISDSVDLQYIQTLGEQPLDVIYPGILSKLSDKFYNEYHLSQTSQKINNSINEK